MISKLSTTVKLIIFFGICALLFLLLGFIVAPLGSLWAQVSFTASILSCVAIIVSILIGVFKWLFVSKPEDNPVQKEGRIDGQ